MTLMGLLYTIIIKKGINYSLENISLKIALNG